MTTRPSNANALAMTLPYTRPPMVQETFHAFVHRLRRGSQTLTDTSDAVQLKIRGQLPEWLQGSLLRIGPACFQVGPDSYYHWFDGLSMLYRFAFPGGGVHYSNRFLNSRTYRDNMAANAIRHGEFATVPRRSLPERLKNLISPDQSDNANVAIAPLGGRMAALSETPLPVAFDPDTLKTTGPLQYQDRIPSLLTTAHPQHDFIARETLNFTTAFGRHTQYNLYRLSESSLKRELIASLPVKRPGYMHSFAATPRYFILTEWPLAMHPLRLALGSLTGTPFYRSLRWEAASDSRLLVVNRSTGRLAHNAAGPAGFAFHQINAWEEEEEIVIDLCLYDDARILDALRLDHLRTLQVSYPQPHRHRLRIHANGTVSSKRLMETGLELPGIAYRRCNMHPYRYLRHQQQ